MTPEEEQIKILANLFHPNYKLALPLFEVCVFAHKCWKCNMQMSIISLTSFGCLLNLNKSYKGLSVEEFEQLDNLAKTNHFINSSTHELNQRCFYYWISSLPDGVVQWILQMQEEIRKITTLTKDFPFSILKMSVPTQEQESYLANFCPHCLSIQGDYFLYENEKTKSLTEKVPYYVFNSGSSQPMLLKCVARMKPYGVV